MTESRVVWLGIGIFVGYLIWKDKSFQTESRSISRVIDQPLSIADSGGSFNGLPPVCGTC